MSYLIYVNGDLVAETEEKKYKLTGLGYGKNHIKVTEKFINRDVEMTISIPEGVKEVVDDAVDGVLGGVGDIAGGVTDGANDVVDGVTDGVGGAVGGVVDGVGGALGGIGGIIGKRSVEPTADDLEPFKGKAGWYTFEDGHKVRGEDAALEYLKSL